MFLPFRALLLWAALIYTTTASVIPQKLEDRSYSCLVDSLLSILRDSSLDYTASSFCSTYIQSTTTVSTTLTATATSSTTTVAPGVTSTVVAVTTTTTDVDVTTTTQAADATFLSTVTTTVTPTPVTDEITMKRMKRHYSSPTPWFFFGYLTSQISSACSCLVTPSPQATKIKTASTATVTKVITSVQPGPSSTTTTLTTLVDTVILDFTTTLAPTQTDTDIVTATTTLPTATSTIICGVQGSTGGPGSGSNSYLYTISEPFALIPAPLGSQCIQNCLNIPTCVSYVYLKFPTGAFICQYYNATVSTYIVRNPTGQSYFEDIGCPAPDL